MAAFILYDPPQRKNLYPFSLTRPIAECRVGIMTIREKWDWMLKKDTTTYTSESLQSLYPLEKEEDNYWIHGGLLPDIGLIEALYSLPEETSLVSDDQILIARSKQFPLTTGLKTREYKQDYLLITYPWELFQNNEEALQRDFKLLAGERASQEIAADIKLVGAENIFIEEDASVTCSTINATMGPVYIAKDAVVMEGSHIFGPVAICEGAVVKMGAKIYGATTIGPYSMAGGEIKNSIFFGYSNKAHDGYLGDSVLGEWCNLGAGTTCSNLKNTAGEIEIQINGERRKVGIKCGMFMGDFSRTAVQSKINSGTIIGVSAHLFEDGFPPKEVPSFYWSKNERYLLDKALKHADNWMRLKGKSLSKEMGKILTGIYDRT